MLNAIISAVLQVGVVLLIAVGAWLLLKRPEPYARFVGISPAPWPALLLVMAASVICAFLITRIPAVQELASAEQTVVGELTKAGVTAEIMAILAVKAVLQTSLTEELFFRGLIGRNLIRRLGFLTGNSIQAVLFGLAHLLLLLSPAITVPVVLVLVLFAGIIGWFLGWMNERLGDGSILPGWAAHGSANLTAYLLLAAAI